MRSSPAPILLFRCLRKSNTLETVVLSDGIARETDEMSAVALLTPTYGRDLELCALLCESVDRHVTSFSKHYLLVPDCDVPLFARFESERRPIVKTLVDAARESAEWYERLPAEMRLPPIEFAYSYITRSGRVDDERLRAMSPAFMARLDASRSREQKAAVRP